MERLRRAVGELPIPLRLGVIGAVALGVPGALVGLFIGLWTYVPTAWAAIFEVGLPAAFLGAVLGLVIGSLVYVYHHVRDNRGARTTMLDADAGNHTLAPGQASMAHPVPPDSGAFHRR